MISDSIRLRRKEKPVDSLISRFEAIGQWPAQHPLGMILVVISFCLVLLAIYRARLWLENLPKMAQFLIFIVIFGIIAYVTLVFIVPMNNAP
jgi:phosphoglycerol transferase MdoB-like AlkP superfamily enzyme